MDGRNKKAQAFNIVSTFPQKRLASRNFTTKKFCWLEHFR